MNSFLQFGIKNSLLVRGVKLYNNVAKPLKLPPILQIIIGVGVHNWTCNIHPSQYLPCLPKITLINPEKPAMVMGMALVVASKPQNCVCAEYSISSAGTTGVGHQTLHFKKRGVGVVGGSCKQGCRIWGGGVIGAFKE